MTHKTKTNLLIQKRATISREKPIMMPRATPRPVTMSIPWGVVQSSFVSTDHIDKWGSEVRWMVITSYKTMQKCVTISALLVLFALHIPSPHDPTSPIHLPSWHVSIHMSPVTLQVNFTVCILLVTCMPGKASGSAHPIAGNVKWWVIWKYGQVKHVDDY